MSSNAFDCPLDALPFAALHKGYAELRARDHMMLVGYER